VIEHETGEVGEETQTDRSFSTQHEVMDSTVIALGMMSQSMGEQEYT